MSYFGREHAKAVYVVHEYPLPYEPETIVRIQEQPMSVMNRFAEMQKKGGEQARSEAYRVISLSVVDESNERIWTGSSIDEIKTMPTKLITALMKMIGQANGGDDDEVEEIAKNFEATE